MWKIILFTIIYTGLVREESRVSAQVLGSALTFGPWRFGFQPAQFSPLYAGGDAVAFITGILKRIREDFNIAYASALGGPTYVGTFA